MKKRTIAVIVAVLMLLSVIAISGCTTQETPSTESTGTSQAAQSEDSVQTSDEVSASELPEYRVAVLPGYYSAAIYYADQMGYDEEEGVNMVLKEFSSGAPMNEAFAAGELEAADIGPAAVHAVGKFDAKIIAQNAKQVAVQLFARSDSDVVKNGPDAKGVYGSADTVKGKMIMGPTGTYAHYEIIGWLEYLGLTINDVNYVNMEYPQAMQAFELGEGDICGMQNPNAYDATQKGYVSVGDPAVIAPMFENLICSANAYDTRRDETAAFLRAVFHAQADFLNDDNLAIEWLTKWYSKEGYEASPEAIADEVKNQRPLLSLEETAKVKVGDALINSAEFMMSLGLIEQDQVDAVKANVRPDILEEICKEAGVEFAQ